MRQPLVIGNWKMNALMEQAQALVEYIRSNTEDFEKVDVAVCPSFPYLSLAAQVLDGSQVAWGSQDVSSHAQGAYTGEVSAQMLVDMKCRYVLVGHSERRQYHHETDALVAQKFIAAQKEGLTPVLCLGETLEERKAGKTNAVIARQLMGVVDKAGIEAFHRAVIAYEPVWAIGTGMAASVTDAQEAHAYLRSCLQQQDEKIAAKTRILYGGSVNAQNAGALFQAEDVDGGLIGGASLQAENFVCICRCALEAN